MNIPVDQILGWTGFAAGLWTQYRVSILRRPVAGLGNVFWNWGASIGLGGVALWHGAYPAAVFTWTFCLIVTVGWWRGRAADRETWRLVTEVVDAIKRDQQRLDEFTAQVMAVYQEGADAR